MQIQETLRAMLNQAGARTVFGEPIAAAGKVVVPVAKIHFGFGGGSGRTAENREEGGGGGGFAARPVGVVEITGDYTRFVPVREGWRLAAAVGLGVCLGLLLAKKRIHVRVEKAEQEKRGGS